MVCLMAAPAASQTQSTSVPASPSTTTTTNPGELLWTIFPQDLYDSSDFPQEFPYLVAGAAATLLAIILTIGIGCFFIERKRRIDAALVAAIAEDRRRQERERALAAEQERRRAEEEQTRRQAEEDEAARREAAMRAEVNAHAQSDGHEEKLQTTSPPPDDGAQVPNANNMNWGMDTSFIF